MGSSSKNCAWCFIALYFDDLKLFTSKFIFPFRFKPLQRKLKSILFKNSILTAQQTWSHAVAQLVEALR